jgi:hypothetical protein
MATWKQLGAALVAVLAVLTPGEGHASPIPPQPLWNVTEKAELIVLARVARTYQLEPGQQEPGLPRGRAELVVLDTWKGASEKTLTVVHWEDLICPAPARFTEGDTAVVFLSKVSGVWDVESLSYGLMTVEGEADTAILREHVKEALALHARPPVSAEARLEWHLRAASHAVTRWAGLYPLLEDILNDFSRPIDQPRAHPLSPGEQQRIAASFLDDPGKVKGLSLVLLALVGHSNVDVDRVAAALLEEELKKPRDFYPSFYPSWLQDSMDLLQARLRVAGSGTERCRPPDSIETEDQQQYGACLRARWQRIRTLHADNFQTLPRPRG